MATLEYIDIINAFSTIADGTAKNTFNEGCFLTTPVSSILGRTIDFNNTSDVSFPVIYLRETDFKFTDKYDTQNGSTRTYTISVFFLDKQQEMDSTPLSRATVNNSMILLYEKVRNCFDKLNLAQPVNGQLTLVPNNLFAPQISGCNWQFQIIEKIQMSGIC